MHDGSGAAPLPARNRASLNFTISENLGSDERLDLLCGQFAIAPPHDRLLRSYLPPLRRSGAKCRSHPAGTSSQGLQLPPTRRRRRPPSAFAMLFEPLEPVELVVEFRPRLRIAVRQIDAGNDDAFDRGLDIARLAVGGVAGKLRPDQHRFGLPRQDGDAVPGLLSAPYRAIASLVDRLDRKIIVGRFH